ncbi:MAG: erythromycin esterase family protein [Phenylobacterium sp.]|uniref:erythromycin esterase family protein n=1 Tax=Phenylobacterium sp. TaxID=1871053 RepID=UPI001A5156C0|nr:erythromycin esterase family protein [Phenylobacterium sp.]MBL8555505.1 erythromycin esterase family protein [Phenylobacterium sp.]
MPDIGSPVERRQVGRDRLLPRGPAGVIAAAAEPLPPIDDPEFGRLFDRFGDARVVLLGEASHGTSEFYRARAAITRWLIEHRGFSIVALEADWPDAQALDARVRGKPRPPGGAFARFPQWMWKNREFDGFLRWLAAHNASHGRGSQARIAGLDLYNLAGSMRAVVDYLERVDPEAAKVARERYGCLTPWAQEPAAYGRMAVSGRYAACEGAVTAMLREMLDRQFRERGRADEDLLDAAQSARLVKDAEAYYRAMYYGGAEAWNLRDTHMFDTLKALLDARRDAKAVVWAHNSHIGDARATEMGAMRDEVNLGQLCREAWGDSARLIGFGTHAGTVACADDWDGPMEVRDVKPSMAESHERQSHNAGIDRFLLDMRPEARNGVRRALADPRLERFIGVIYRPETERWSHYADCRLPEQYDAWVWFDETTAVTPLAPEHPADHPTGAEDTWPFGL